MTYADLLIFAAFAALAWAGMATALAAWCDLVVWAIDAAGRWIDRERAK